MSRRRRQGPPGWRPLALAAAGAALLVAALLLTAAATDRAVVVPSWWLVGVMAALFAAADVVGLRLRLHLHMKRETMTLTLVEIPLVLGLLLLEPWPLLGVALVGTLGGALWRRTSVLRAGFNVCLVALEVAISSWLLGQLLGTTAPADAEAATPGVVAAVLVVVLAQALLSVCVVGGAIWITTGEVDGAQVRSVARAGCVVAVGNASVALLVAELALGQPSGLVPLAVVVAVLLAAYRGHARLLGDHGRLEELTRIAAALSEPLEGEALCERVLREARDVTGCAVAALVWAEADGAAGASTRLSGQTLAHDEAAASAWWQACLTTGETVERAGSREVGEGPGVAVPLPTGTARRAALVVEDRVSVRGSFGPEDVRQLRALADHASVALQRAHLTDVLRADLADQERRARTDGLTGLPNGAALVSRLDDDAAAGGAVVVVLDLDGFADVNEVLGHDAGDELLRAVARRLVATAGPAALVARVGPDEFAVLLPAAEGRVAAERATALLEAVTARDGRLPVEARATGGLTVAAPGERGASTLHRAQRALAAARAERMPLRTWSTHDEAAAARRLALVADLRQALSEDALEVHYQPVVAPGTGVVLGVEALVRWTSERHGRVGPDEFVPLAEQSGLVQPLTAAVLRQALADVATWRHRRPQMTVAVNLSPLSLRDAGCARDVEQALAEAGLPPTALELEITETADLADDEQTAASLEQLRRLGVRLLVDDFGTGQSSLAYLQVLPVSGLKIDRSFVGPMLEDPSSAAIVGAAARLARDLGLHVVAEGVEDASTMTALTGLGVDAVQGYHVARPMPADALRTWLRERPTVLPGDVPAQRAASSPVPVVPS
ncbi:putative bifunctional diguanylate cyclase/phosphodiesterase [Pseudokineococcus sp. 1T1Z-3]|uniref:putative bifunctional diguanylate cyclase/phosphodiesterase n=1 Tax=Pseudokineococcus sp. 1T1Z-3 TaxID=3132745 RepID=UPI0030A40A7F